MEESTNCPTYSIITVCLNDRQGLKKTAESIGFQTDKSYEWLVIDGGSSDGSIEFIENCPLVTAHISEPDKGIYDAMNKGIGLASGEYYLFLNAGDFLHDEQVLKNAHSFLGADLVIGNIKTLGHPEPTKNRIRYYESRNVGKHYIYNNSLPHQATFIKHDLFAKYGLYEEKLQIAADWDFFARVLKQNVSICFIPFCVSTFMMNGISVKMKYSSNLKKERNEVRRRNFNVFYRFYRAVSDRTFS